MAAAGAIILDKQGRPNAKEKRPEKAKVFLPDRIEGERKPIEANVRAFRPIDIKLGEQTMSLEASIDPLGAKLKEISAPSGKFYEIDIDASVFANHPTGSLFISFGQQGGSVVTLWTVCERTQELAALLQTFPEKCRRSDFPFLVNAGEPLPEKYANVFNAPRKGEKLEEMRVSFVPEASHVAIGRSGSFEVEKGGVSPSAIWTFTNLGHPQKEEPLFYPKPELQSA